MRQLEEAEWTYAPQERIVVCLDMVDSSNFIGDLTNAGHLETYLALFREVTQYFWEEIAKISVGLNTQFKREPRSLCYNFLGDGWILLFPPETEGERLLKFLNGLCLRFQSRLDYVFESNPTQPTGARGFRFGIDCGELLRSRVFGQHEYIGMPIITACRLQKHVKELDPSRADQVLVSDCCYQRYFGRIALRNSSPKKIPLRNIRGAEEFRCVLFSLGRANPEISAPKPTD